MSGNDTQVYDIAIVGSGMVGATLAALLEPLPVRIALLDRQKFDPAGLAILQEQPAFDARVSALTSASTTLLRDLGVWQSIVARRCCAYQDMRVWDAEGTGSIHFSAAAINEPELGTIVENSLVLAALQEKLARQDNIDQLEFAIDSLEPGPGGQRIVASDGESLTATLLIAADGGNSRLRELAEFRIREWDYPHHAVVTTVKTELEHRHTAWQRFMDTGPLAFLPLSPGPQSADQHFSSIVWSALPELAAELMALDEEAFNQRLGSAIEERLGKIEWSAQRFSFPLRQRHASDYVKDNIVLVGDAAHTIHPLAGQGVNLGLLDVAVLAEELQRSQAAGRTLDDPVPLQRYQRRRRGHNLGMMYLMEGFRHLFADQPLPLRWLRNVGMSGVDSLPLVKRELARRAMGLS